MSDDFEEPETQTLPLDAWHRARGGRMVPFAGYHMPVQYEGIMPEHLWTRESAGLFDVSHMGQLRLTGDDVEAALEAVLPTALTDHPLKRARYSLLLDERGGILDDLMLTRLPGNLFPDPFGAPSQPLVSSEVEKRDAGDAQRFSTSAQSAEAYPELVEGLETNGGGKGDASGGIYMVVNGAMKWDDIAHLREHLPDEITLNHLDDRALLALQGPKAVAAFARLVPGVADLVFMQGDTFDWYPNPSPSGEGQGVGDASQSAASADGPHPNPSPEGEGLPVRLWISRSGYTGEDGLEISVPADRAAALADAICALPEVKPIGLGARDSLRLEAGLPLYGHDLDPDTTPYMADLGFGVMKRRREGGGFLGHERLAAERAQGAVSKRVGLIVDGRQPVREGADVLDADGSAVGRVTSGGHSPSTGQPIAMAYVPTALAVPGTTVTLSQRGKVHSATVTAMPFVPHRYYRGAAK